jgi:hypothetical protein
MIASQGVAPEIKVLGDKNQTFLCSQLEHLNVRRTPRGALHPVMTAPEKPRGFIGDVFIK